MRNIIFILLLFFSGIALGQTKCDSLSPTLIKQFDGYSQKKFKQLKHKNNLDPKTAFDIATYFREKNDTAYKQWYLLCIELTKKCTKIAIAIRALHPNRFFIQVFPIIIQVMSCRQTNGL